MRSFTTPTVDGQDVDNLLAEDLNRLSIEERETVFQEIHGVDQVVEESEALIQVSLAEFEYELDEIPSSQKTAYEKALNRGPPYRDYVTSREFRLKFLRCENFDSKKAARRFVLYFEGMLKQFGPQVLGRPLQYSDLNPDTQEFLSTGVYQLAHQARDTVGRTIMVCNPKEAQIYLKRPEQLVQAHIYLWHCAIEDDVSTQRRGAVSVVYIPGKLAGKFNPEAVSQVVEVQRGWFPIKVSALHLCLNDPMLHLLQPLVWLALGRELRPRVRLHCGSHTECLYKLMSFGIRIDDTFPIHDQGGLQTDIHHRWLSLRQAKERSDKVRMKMQNKKRPGHHQPAFEDVDYSAGESSPSGSAAPIEKLIEKPAPNDVALWRGRVYQKHAGNIRLRELMAERRAEYDETPAGFKTLISREIAQIVRNKFGGRFLTREPSGFWIELSEKEVELRISKSFRSARGTAKKKYKKKTKRLNNDDNVYTEPNYDKRPDKSKRIRTSQDEHCSSAHCCMRSCSPRSLYTAVA